MVDHVLQETREKTRQERNVYSRCSNLTVLLEGHDVFPRRTKLEHLNSMNEESRGQSFKEAAKHISYIYKDQADPSKVEI